QRPRDIVFPARPAIDVWADGCLTRDEDQVGDSTIRAFDHAPRAFDVDASKVVFVPRANETRAVHDGRRSLERACEVSGLERCFDDLRSGGDRLLVAGSDDRARVPPLALKSFNEVPTEKPGRAGHADALDAIELRHRKVLRSSFLVLGLFLVLRPLA